MNREPSGKPGFFDATRSLLGMKPKNTIGPKAGTTQFDYFIKNELDDGGSKKSLKPES